MPAGMRGREGNMKKKLLGLVACVATLALSGALLAGCSGSGDKTGGDSADGKETLTASTKAIRRTASSATTASSPASTWIWLRQCATRTVGS